MFCRNCQRIIDNDSAFCEYCGQEVQEETSAGYPEPTAEPAKNSETRRKTAVDYNNFVVEERYRSLRFHIEAIKVIGVLIGSGTGMLILYIISEILNMKIEMEGLIMAGIPTALIIIIFYGIANRTELLISLEETNRKSNLLLLAIFEKIDEASEDRNVL